MLYEAELYFLRDVLNKYHLLTNIIDTKSLKDNKFDIGFRSLCDNDNGQFGVLFPDIKSNTIYKLTDAFLCRYIFFRLPDREMDAVFVIGPYIKEDMSRQQLLERAELSGVEPKHIKQLEEVYATIPIMVNEGGVLGMLETLGERMWGSLDNFTFTDIDVDSAGSFIPFALRSDKCDGDSATMDMQIMEKRYAYENEMMQAVSLGQMHKVESIFESFSDLAFENRLPDPLRNIKNYCIIMNTLLRKAAENGGVHPTYLNDISSTFASRIEQLSQNDNIKDFMIEVFRSYCGLVRDHSIKKYSPAVQKAITCIDYDLTADLSLSALAAKNNVSAGYLSALFRKETGKTLTDFVNERRVKKAKQLLKTTNLQIQTIAQHCGVLDVHYFSKVFRKHTGMTPKEYRETKHTRKNI